MTTTYPDLHRHHSRRGRQAGFAAGRTANSGQGGGTPSGRPPPASPGNPGRTGGCPGPA